MIYLELFIGFLKVGLFAFGGAYAAIPLIRDVVIENGWLDDEMFSYMIAVSESTPGPIIINLATYVGNVKGGFLGALIATSSVVLPCFLIILFLVSILRKLIKNKVTRAVIDGLKSCVVGIIIATGFFMILQNIIAFDESKNEINFKMLYVTIFLLLLNFFYKWKFKNSPSPILFIIFSSIIGLLVWGI